MNPIRNSRERGAMVLIGGPCRVGKSIVAFELSRRTGLRLVGTDPLRNLYNSIEDPDARLLAKARTFFDVIEQESGGLIIEGEELIYRNRASTRTRSPSEMRQDVSLSLDLALEIRERFGARIFCIGSARDTVEEKARAIIEYGASNACWFMDRQPTRAWCHPD
jgi:hypothetical protein